MNVCIYTRIHYSDRRMYLLTCVAYTSARPGDVVAVCTLQRVRCACLYREAIVVPVLLWVGSVARIVLLRNNRLPLIT